MIKFFSLAGLTLAGFLAWGVSSTSQQEQEVQVASSTASQSDLASLNDTDDAAIRKSAADFAKAFNDGKAKEIAGLWTPDGIYVNENGQRYVGREAIQKEYESFFADYPGVRIEIEIDSIRLLHPEMAIEEGRATVGPVPGTPPAASRYVAIHVKQGGKWQVASVHDVRVDAPSNHVFVSDLEWLIGSWRAENELTHVHMTFRWIANKNFLERTFSLTEGGRVALSGTQIIGMDPSSGQVTSWLFDSTGGHDVSVWSPHETGWIIESNGVTMDGVATSASYRWSYIDENAMAWESSNRTVGNTPLADTDQVLLKRVAATDSSK